jgi:hypothetical protein
MYTNRRIDRPARAMFTHNDELSKTSSCICDSASDCVAWSRTLTTAPWIGDSIRPVFVFLSDKR